MPVVGLFSFALSYRIESQSHEALQSQIGGESLRLRLPLLGMARLEKNGRISTGLVGPVKIGGDKEARQALKNHFLNGVGLRLDTASNFGIQRPVVIGQTTQNLEECFANPFFPALRVGNCPDFNNGALPPLQLLLCNLVHPSEKRLLDGGLSSKR